MKIKITSVLFELFVLVGCIFSLAIRFGGADETSFPPATKIASGLVSPMEPTVQIEKDKILLENSHFAIIFSTKNGLMLERLFNKHTETECLLQNKSSSLFSVLFSTPQGEEWVGSDWFDVLKTKLDTNDRAKYLTLNLHCEKPLLNAEFLIQLQDSEEIECSLKISNVSTQAGKFSIMFPLLERVIIGDDPKEDYYFYPFMGGWSSNRSYEIAGVYGTSSGSLLLISVFNPKLGGGVYIYVKDSSGASKVTQLRKSNVEEKAIPSYIPLWGPDSKRMPAYTPNPFPSDLGTSMGLRTFHLTLEPAQTISLPTAIMGVHAGDFRRPLESYTKWVRTWWRPPDPPLWLKASFNFAGVHDYDALKNSRYVAKVGTLSPRDHVYQWSAWWKHSDLDRDGKNTRADRWYKHNFGEYNYEERWGGLPALREEIKRFHKAGSKMILLVQSYLLWKHSGVAEKYYKKWGFLMPDGTYNIDWSDPPMNSWGMCTRHEEWQDYIAGVCARLIRETDADGIYMDSAPIVPFGCINPNHHHDERDPAPDIARHLCKIRDAIHKENPEAIFWVEHPASDYLTQFSDMTWLSTFSSDPYSNFNDYGLHFLRFYFPELKYAEWNGDSSKPELWRQTFFNGIGMGTFYSIPDYMAKTGQIMRENAKTFASLYPKPLIPTQKDGVFANLFPIEEKAIYTIWNRNQVAISDMLLKVKHRKNYHYVELVSGREVKFETKGEEDLLYFEIPAREVACIAQLPRLLEVKRQVDALQINLLRQLENIEVRLVYSDAPDDPGITLHSSDYIELDKIGYKMLTSPQRIIIKLFQIGELIDQVNI